MASTFTSEQTTLLLFAAIFFSNSLLIVPLAYFGCTEIYNFQAGKPSKGIFRCTAKESNFGQRTETEILLLKSVEEFHAVKSRSLQWPFSRGSEELQACCATSSGRIAEFFSLGSAKFAVKIGGFGRVDFCFGEDGNVIIVAEWLPIGRRVSVENGKFVFDGVMSLDICI